MFDRKKGIGIEIGEKDSKGYSRWCKEKEMKGDKGVEIVDPVVKDSPYAGIPLVNDGKHLWVDNGEYHNLVIGSTGSGKSQTVVEPMVELLIKKGESMIITDPKGELYKAASVYMKERGYNVVVLNFREPQNGNAWNPLSLPYQYYQDGNLDKAIELLDDVGMNILYDPNNKSGDPFWEKSSADYFSGLALGLFEDASQDQINLNSINFMSTVGEEKFAASTYIKEYFTLKGEASNAYVYASNTINAPADTKGGILSVFRQKIRLFASRENLSEMLAYSDFDMRNIGKEKTAVFIIIHDEKTTYHGLATIFIKQCYETLIDVAQNNGGKLPYRTNFILDEFANMPPLKDVTTMVTAARSRDIRFTFIIQNFAQLKSVYGNEDAETIKGNCGNLVYLISTELAALEEISKMCGEVKSGDKDKTASTPLVTVTDLQKLKLFEAIIIRWRLSPFKTKYTPNFKMDWGHPKFEAEYPVRKKREIKLFDVKEFTKKKKSDKIKNSLNEKGPGLGGSNPFKNPMDNPFGAPKQNSDPFGMGNSNPFGAPKNDGGLFGGLGGGIDLDAMMKDIDRKIAELDAEEARQKQEQAKMKEAEQQKANAIPSNDIPKFNSPIENSFSNPMSNSMPNSGGLSLLDDRMSGDYQNRNDIPRSNVRDVEPVVEKVQPKEQLSLDTSLSSNNLEDTFGGSNKLDSFNIYGSSNTSTAIPTKNSNTEISIGNEKTNIAVATSSPYDEDDFGFDALPKVEKASVIQPNYNSGAVVKTNDTNDYNIYNSVPNIMDTV
ncbi:MAG: type IV secretory system conjugative DNA transfer family protein, partial [Bacilli bacterium]|nr:type IV secretory system conjugative DNA transfer family protein [Bacilli bacterium]